jgi:hypothetical protein
MGYLYYYYDSQVCVLPSALLFPSGTETSEFFSVCKEVGSHWSHGAHVVKFVSEGRMLVKIRSGRIERKGPNYDTIRYRYECLFVRSSRVLHLASSYDR